MRIKSISASLLVIFILWAIVAVIVKTPLLPTPWAVIHAFPEVYGLRGNGGWSVAFVRPGRPDGWTWRENHHLVALTEAESEIRVWCKGEPGFYVRQPP